MKKVYTEIIEGHPKIPLLYPNFGIESRDSILYMNNAFQDMKRPFVEIVKKPEEADYILLAHNYSSLKEKMDYVERMSRLASDHGKKLLIFAHQDSDAPIEIPHAIVFRTSQYRSNLRENEIMMPAYAEDLLASTEILPRSKKEVPTIGFCGWAQYKNFKNFVGTFMKDLNIEFHALLFRQPKLRARKKGISFRMKALRVLKKSNLVGANFIIRRSYSGHAKTISIDPSEARLEYRGNMLNSDFALVIKGDGNYSYRFYEALSLGRIPLIVDTECVFPLEDVIDYDSFCIRVPYQNISRLPEIVREKFNTLTNEEFIAMQYKAREVFEKYLRIDSFLRVALEKYL